MAYKKHSYIPFSQPDTAPIWRYMDFTKPCALLDQKTLYFCSPAVLAKDAPFEGQPPFLMIKNISNDIAAMSDEDARKITSRNFQTKASFKTYLDKNSLTAQFYLKQRWDTFMYANFVNCWHQSDYESKLCGRYTLAANLGYLSDQILTGYRIVFRTSYQISISAKYHILIFLLTSLDIAISSPNARTCINERDFPTNARCGH